MTLTNKVALMSILLCIISAAIVGVSSTVVMEKSGKPQFSEVIENNRLPGLFPKNFALAAIPQIDRSRFISLTEKHQGMRAIDVDPNLIWRD